MSEVILDSIRFSTRVAVAALVAVTLALAVLAATLGLLLFRMHTDNDRLVHHLQNEKVCSESNQGAACVALFDRLANNLTPDQRVRLACAVFSAARVEPNIDCGG